MKLVNTLIALTLTTATAATEELIKGRRLDDALVAPEELFDDYAGKKGYGDYAGKKGCSDDYSGKKGYGDYSGKKGYGDYAGKKGYDGECYEPDIDTCVTGKKGSYVNGKKGSGRGKGNWNIELPDYGDSCVICDKQNKNKPTELILQYMADGQNSAFQPAGKATCREGDYPEIARIVVDETYVYEIEDGDMFKIFPSGANTYFEIVPTGPAVFDDDINCYIHTSCSVPIVVGDQIGPFLVVGDDECEPPEEPECPSCEVCDTGRPEMLTLKYNSAGVNSEYQPEKKASCRAGMYPASTMLTVEGDTFDVVDGTTFTITPQFGSFSAETDFKFSAASDMDCYIHTSCSVPIVPGDQIGPFEVIGDEDCPPPPDRCIEAEIGVGDDGETIVTVTFDYANLTPDRKWAENCDSRDDDCPDFDLTPLPSDWVGFYPCEDKNMEPIGFSREPSFWAYTCYDRNCRRDPPESATSDATIVFDDDTMPSFGTAPTGSYKSIAQIEAAGGGCYVVLLNKIDGFSAPPYYNLCEGNEIMFPDKSG
eukprot:CAMPEP_0178935594 /NCGR_PEP_ID=MMETSP0786-20121207/24644_1 /TAXON_ID=186022 /ORGANISM="Thalassionema frauenfeldii, Strain CCMP 1798" /LENGTH=536 /DNA_ID=CAMNT_0020613783 /DNA_START=27 /DNA_END=1637 /DNA_ORIENTATION=-